MRRFRTCLLAAATVISQVSAASGQSPFAICADTVPNRIVSTGPIRAVIATVDGMRVCLAVEGFGDSVATHPRDWADPSRFVILESRIPGDRLQLQESRILRSWMKNDRPLPIDSTVAAWRALVLDVVSAQWDVAARRMEQQDLEKGITDLQTQEKWVLAQIDTIHMREDTLKVAISEGISKARFDRQRRIAGTTQSEFEARAQLSKAQTYFASIPRTPANANEIEVAREALVRAEDRVRTAVDAARNAQSVVPEQAVAGLQSLLEQLNAKGAIASLRAMLTDLDVDNRIATLRAALRAVDDQPDPAVRLNEAAAKLRAIIAR